MKLFIDTSDAEKIVVGIDGENHTTASKHDKSQRLLPVIEELVQAKGKTLQDISQVEVATGPGSFTGLRVGISVANTLGYVLHIPVNDKDVIKDGPVLPNY